MTPARDPNRFLFVKSCGIIAVESLLWNHCCGIIVVGIIAVESLLWNHCCGIIAVESGNGIQAMESWLWIPGCVNKKTNIDQTQNKQTKRGNDHTRNGIN